MRSSVRFALSSFALAAALSAVPATASASGEVAAPAEVATGEHEPLACDAPRPSMRRRPPPVEMTLPGYLWSRLRGDAHAYADVAAYALITATSRIAVAAAHEKAHEQAPSSAPGAPSKQECGKRPRA
jgi:hypothetical protein